MSRDVCPSGAGWTRIVGEILLWSLLLPGAPAADRGVEIVGLRKPIETYLAEVPYRRIHVLVVGIDNYRNAPPLRYAVADARAVARLMTGFGARQEDVATLLNDQATREAILNSLVGRFGRAAGEDDAFIMFFAGHGVATTTAEGREEGYLLAADTVSDEVEDTGLSMSLLVDTLDFIKARHRLLVVDACYSGFAVQRSAGIGLDVATEAYVAKMKSLPVTQIITAGGRNETATEAGGSGLFTERFLSGLEGVADQNLDGIITGFELGAYLRKDVSLRSEGRQTPQFGAIRGEGDFVFVRNDFSREQVDEMRRKRNLLQLYETSYYAGIRHLKAREWVAAKEAFFEALRFKPDDFWAHEKIRYVESLSLYREVVPDRLGREMILVPAGSFVMGSGDSFPDEMPERNKFVPAFYLDKYEVTNRDFAVFLADPAARRFLPPGAPPDIELRPAFWGVAGYTEQDFPVVGVNWYAAMAFAGWAGKRLPSEQEWEKAARGDNGQPYYWGKELVAEWEGRLNWGRNNTVNGLSSGDQFPGDVAPYGHRNLGGNVSEWVDRADNDYLKSRVPVDGDSRPFKVVRGGNYQTLSLELLRPSVRRFRHPLSGSNVVGFRCARDVAETDRVDRQAQ